MMRSLVKELKEAAQRKLECMGHYQNTTDANERKIKELITSLDTFLNHNDDVEDTCMEINHTVFENT